MARIVLLIVFLTLASPAWGTTFFLAPASAGGSDSNSGTSASTPWLSPNHAVNCGDVILAAASSSYAASNFENGNWGPVNCPAGNNVAWLKCVTFDACKISISTSPYHGMSISASFWGVQGWEVTTTGSNTYGDCFNIYPPTSSANIHHIIFANNIANVCQADGFGSSNNGSASSDYIAIVGNIAYSAAHSSHECYSGITIAAPVETDSVSGTHMYIAGNFAWDSTDPGTCAGGTPTDGEGIILDTWTNYNQQALVEDNIVFLNGSRGLDIFLNNEAPIFFRFNTVYGNANDTSMNSSDCADILLQNAVNVQVMDNISASDGATGCGSNTKYAVQVASGSNTDVGQTNWFYSPAGHTTSAVNSGSFAFGSNTTGTNPSFANPSDPGAPSCGSAANVPACMATVISNFTPQTSAAQAYGYRAPSITQVSDPLFPAWLCNANLPSGLVTMGCIAQSSLPAPPTNISVMVQ